MSSPVLYRIRVPAGTIIGEVRNGEINGVRRTVWAPTKVLEAVEVDAARHDDGAYGFVMDGRAYVVAGGTAEVL